MDELSCEMHNYAEKDAFNMHHKSQLQTITLILTHKVKPL